MKIPDNVTLDVKKGMWHFKNKSEENNGRIGVDFRERGYGFIGVYDRTNEQHLNHMLFHSRSATADKYSWSED